MVSLKTHVRSVLKKPGIRGIHFILENPGVKYVRSALEKPTVYVLMTVSGGLAATSDLVCQKIVEKHEKIDVVRTGRFALLISCMVVPITHKFFHILEKRIPAVSSGNYVGKYKWIRPIEKKFPSAGYYVERAKVGLKRVTVDQLFAAPTFTAIVLFSLNLMETFSWNFFETLSPGIAFARTKAIYCDVIKSNWCLWPAVQFLNFTFNPLRYRIYVIQVVAFFWNIYISYAQHESKNKIHSH